MAQTSRADLLLALHVGAGDALALEHDDRHWWGYRRQRRAEVPPAPAAAAAPALATPAAPPETQPVEDPLAQPLQMPQAWVLVRQSVRDVPREVEHLPPLTEDELGALAHDPVPHRDLVPWARVLPGLRRHTDRQVPGGVDWWRLASAMARQQLPRRLPRRRWQRWPHRLMLVLDFSSRLDPYRWDFHRLALQLEMQMPSAALSVRLLRHGPGGPWQTWPHPRKPSPKSAMHEWEAHLAPGTVLLLATDLGLFDPSPSAHQAWLDWGTHLRAQGCRPIVMAPLSPQLLTAATLEHFELLRWSADSRWHRERRAANGADDSALDALLALAATALRIDPPLLRAWRCLLPGGGDAGLEGRLWNHPQLQSGDLSCATRPEHLDAGLARHTALPGALRQAARQVQRSQHAHLKRSLGCAEALRWHVADGGAAVSAGIAPATDPLSFVKRLLHGLRDEPPTRPARRRSLQGAAEVIQATASPQVRAQDPALFAALDAAVARWRSRQPAVGDAAAGATRHWQLVQQGQALRLVPAGWPGPGQRLGSPVPAGAQGAVVGLASDVVSFWLPLRDDGVHLARLGEGAARLEATLDSHTWVVEQVARPWWASAWRVADGIVSAAVPSPALGADGRAPPVWFMHPWTSQDVLVLEGGGIKVGLDDFGAYAEITLVPPQPGQRPPAAAPPLRLRWIPAGRFLMGSPDGQGIRNAQPQHEVLVSQGFWLGEGPCTQAVWEAVMGRNPSEFRQGEDAARRPVENVSYEDVQEFVRKLGSWLPEGCEAELPSEAQWEYAARAGSETAYPWGDEAEDGRANWGEQQGGTTPVGRYAPNGWGLLDMQGNVWEWCADAPRAYTARACRDPRGDMDTDGPRRRAVRGGSWFDHPGLARSAFRFVWPPGSRDRLLGFRLALRSPSPVAGGPSAEPTSGPGGASAGAGRPGGVANLSRPKPPKRRKKKARR